MVSARATSGERVKVARGIVGGVSAVHQPLQEREGASLLGTAGVCPPPPEASLARHSLMAGQGGAGEEDGCGGLALVR